MGEWGKLERRFESLSANKRWFFYATNNRGKSWGSSTLRAYYDGYKIATSAGRPEFTAPLKGQRRGIPAALVTSKNNRVRILTLDIPGNLLQ